MINFDAKRCEAMAEQIANIIPLSAPVFEALKSVSRSEFVPISLKAYELNPQPIRGAQWISSPLTVAKMSMYLECENAENVLEIGCGSGYQAAILSKIVRRVFSVERIERLVIEAKKHFENLGISNINVRYDDGNCGWKTFAPYERILLSAAAEKIDERLFLQLATGGILLAPINKNGKQFITQFRKNENGEISSKILEECEFVPLLNGKE